MSEQAPNKAGNGVDSITVGLPDDDSCHGPEDTTCPICRFGEKKAMNLDIENTRRELIATRVKYGANTPIGHRCSNIIELLKAQAPPSIIAKQMAELKALLAAQ